jgi:hypothetical protein
MRFNSTVSVYWLWLPLIAGILAVVPCVPYPGKAGATVFLSLIYVYANGLRGYNDSYTLMSADKWILLHAAVSVVLAVVATAIHRLWAKRRQPDYQTNVRIFALGNLLWTVAAVACVFGCLASFGAIHALYTAVLIFVGGRIATFLFAAVGL